MVLPNISKTSQRNNKFFTWIDQRFPIIKTWNAHVGKYYTPKNFNFWYFFGVFSMVVLVNQIVTGIWLTMYYTPTEKDAFDSVVLIMHDVKFGWLLRYMHTTGASAFFIVIYLHMYRGIIYGSFKKPRELVWLLGMVLFILLLAEAGSGYVLPWGQMSYWATKVLVEIYSAIPWIGKSLTVWVQGDYNVSGITLHRFFAFHVIAIPLGILFAVFLHIVALHKVGSNNPDGIEIKAQPLDQEGKPIDSVPFHPYYTVKDFMGVIIFLGVFFAVIFFAPTMHGYFIEAENTLPANPLVTPQHIAPPWYIAGFYCILRAVPNKLLGVVCVALAIAFLFVMPWLDRSKVKSIRYRGIFSKIAICIFVLAFVALITLGTLPLSPTNVFLSRIALILYLLFFIAMPFYTKYEKTKPLPERLRISTWHV